MASGQMGLFCFSMSSLIIIQQFSPSLFMWWFDSKREKTGAVRTLKCQAWNWHSNTSVTFYWLKQVTEPAQIQEEENRTLLFSFFFLNTILFILFIYGCVGSSFLCEGLLQLWQAGATLHRGARGLSLSRPLLLRSTGSRRAGSVAVAHGPSCSAACGILPDQGSNPCPLHWQADSQPLRHQGSPEPFF